MLDVESSCTHILEWVTNTLVLLPVFSLPNIDALVVPLFKARQVLNTERASASSIPRKTLQRHPPHTGASQSAAALGAQVSAIWPFLHS